MQDSEIINLFFNRDEKALSYLVEIYGKELLKIAYAILQNDDDAQECINDSYLKIWQSIPPKNPQDYLYTYSAKIVRTTALDILRKRKAQKRDTDITVSFEGLESFFSDSKLADANLAVDDLRKEISIFLKAQPKIERFIFIRYYWFYESISEISAFYNLKESTVRTRLYRCRNKLKKHLVKNGYII